MMKYRFSFGSAIFLFLLVMSSCVKSNLYKRDDNKIEGEQTVKEAFKGYTYSWDQEIRGAEAEVELVLEIDADQLSDISLSIPPLKYNKSLLFMLTQDDCKHSAFCRTWAAINGKPITWHDLDRNYYYDIEQLESNDLPPDTYSLGKSLGSTDGHGNEVRFHFATTIAPEWDYMGAGVQISPGFGEHFYRFHMKGGLRWANVREMLHYGTAVAFHDVKAQDVNDVNALQTHFDIAQSITMDSLGGRGIKFLAEPNGNKNYLEAGRRYLPIETMTAQAGVQRLIPYQVDNDLSNIAIERLFAANTTAVKDLVNTQMKVDVSERRAVYIGLHEMGNDGVQLLSWLNENYGKDGSDAVWFPSQEEYYEYNYYRQHCQLQLTKSGKSIKIKVKFPEKSSFYYPSLTLNVNGLSPSAVKSVSSNAVVKGLSHGANAGSVSINIDCRKFLNERAAYYVQKWQGRKSISNLRDAQYFVSMLKASAQKEDLLAMLSAR